MLRCGRPSTRTLLSGPWRRHLLSPPSRSRVSKKILSSSRSYPLVHLVPVCSMGDATTAASQEAQTRQGKPPNPNKCCPPSLPAWVSWWATRSWCSRSSWSTSFYCWVHPLCLLL
jgi:hypothetical protein